MSVYQRVTGLLAGRFMWFWLRGRVHMEWPEGVLRPPPDSRAAAPASIVGLTQVVVLCVHL